jgi:hypothetical protein
MKKSVLKNFGFIPVFFFAAATVFAGGQVREVPVETMVLARGQQCEPAPEGWRAGWIASPGRSGK